MPTLLKRYKAAPGIYCAPKRRKDGRYSVFVHVFLGQIPGTTKQQVRTDTFTADDLNEAKARAEEWGVNTRAEFRKGTLSEPCKDTLAEYGRKWLAGRKPNGQDDDLKRSTWDWYSEIFRTYVEEPKDRAMPRIGHLPMERLGIEHVLGVYTYLRTTLNHRGEKGRGRAKALHAVLRPVFSAYFSADPKHRVNLAGALRERKPFGRQHRKRPQAYTGEQLAAFLKAADTDRYRAFWYLFAFTGMRPGEMLALTREDVDLINLQVRVSKRLRAVPERLRATPEEKFEIDEPKTEDSVREVLVPQELRPILERHLAAPNGRGKARRRFVGQYGDLVFKTDTGQPVDWSNLRENYRRICRRAGLGTFVGELPLKPKGRHGPCKQQFFKPLLKPYALRHTHATLSLADGVPIEVISERLGHGSGPAFTMNTYVGKQTHRQKLAADAAGKRMRALDTGTEG